MQPQSTIPVEQFLYRYRKLGYSFFNTLSPEKKILTRWTQYQTHKPTDLQIETWLTLDTQNWAIVTGEVSNLIVYDVDTKNGGDPTPFLNRGLYEVRTPSGGYHFYTTYDPVLKSTKHKKAQHKGILSAVDVQSNGAVVFAPPSHFPQGGYTIVNDVPVTPLPDDLLALVLAAMEPEAESQDYTPYTPRLDPLSGRPGDVFNASTSWDEVLIPMGWHKVGGVHHDGTQYWRRPEKKDGISASTNWRGYDLLFVYTTQYAELTPMKGYTKFGFYTAMKHGGDFRACAKQLIHDGRNYANVRNSPTRYDPLNNFKSPLSSKDQTNAEPLTK